MSTSYAHIDFTPPEEVARYAAGGLAMRREFGRGGTDVGLAMAQSLSERQPCSPDTIRRMYSFFARHEVDKQGKNFNNPQKPSNGFIAWHLWGGDPGKAWATHVRNEMKKADEE